MWQSVRHRFNHNFVRRLWGFIFVLPAIVFFLWFSIYPMIRAFYISLTKYNLLSAPRYIGLNNYRSFIGDEYFLNSMRATLTYVVGSVVPLLILSLFCAFLLQRWKYFSNTITMILYSPMVISAVVASIVWKLLFHPLGLVNTFTQAAWGKTYLWLSDRSVVQWAIIVVSLWKSLGYYTILWLSGLKSIPISFYEAAEIDGASEFQRLTKISLPLLRPTMAFILAISTISAFKSFELQYVLTEGGPADATNVIALSIYRLGLKHLQMGKASALSVIMFFIIMVLTLIQLRVVRADEVSFE